LRMARTLPILWAMSPRLARTALCIAFLAASCGSNSPGGEPRAAVPLDVWVRDLCTALGEMLDGSPNADRQVTTREFLKRNIREFEHLVASVNAIGVPDIADGETIRDDVIAGLRASLDALEQVRDEALAMGEHPSDAEKAALVELASSALRYPAALWVLLFQADYSDLRVYLSDPVEEETVARLSDWLQARPEVVSVDHQTKAEACERFVEMFDDDPDIVAHLDCDALPEILGVDIRGGEATTTIEAELAGDPGVDSVVISGVFANPEIAQAIGDEQLARLDPVLQEATRQPTCMTVGGP
jgi:FtsX extracellular domain